MEQFRLRVRNEPKRGYIWELHLFPSYPRRQLREADARVMGSSSVPETIHWLKIIAEPYLLRADPPTDLEQLNESSEPCWLLVEDGMRLALAFVSARYLANAKQRRMFHEGLKSLPSEVVLYWFTLSFYGYRQSAGRAALRTLLTHEEPDEPVSSSRKKAEPRGLQLPLGFLDEKNDERMENMRKAMGEYGKRLHGDNEPEPTSQGS